MLDIKRKEGKQPVLAIFALFGVVFALVDWGVSHFFDSSGLSSKVLIGFFIGCVISSIVDTKNSNKLHLALVYLLVTAVLFFIFQITGSW
ncbi:hypothetical protein AB6D66_00095 [Vibrio pomeroyi]|uniref:Holin n=1 Tax=Vibrio pomeroyi TaxID=198832 RepID=A0ABV4MQN2_9VIBR|nr:hypothetical protein [Vibrio atlanticus]MCZ4311316.1 hypothetical protein [Vibrio atlanticus]